MFFATDFHGSDVCFRKFLNASSFYGADILIAGGDLTGKLLVPVIETREGWLLSRGGKDVIYHSDEGVTSAERKLRDRGLYPFRTTTTELDRVRSEPKAEAELRDRLIKEQLDRWNGWTEERLGTAELFVIPGNDDPWIVDDMLREWGKRNIDGRSVQVRGVTVVGLGVSNETPWKSPREFEEHEIAKLIDDALQGVTGSLIFNIHVPPRGTKLDLCPRVDAELRPVLRHGEYEMIHAGSDAIRECIERFQPTLSLHGHIHESAAFELMGETIAINPGSEYGAGVLRGLLATISDGRLVSHQLVNG